MVFQSKNNRFRPEFSPKIYRLGNFCFVKPQGLYILVNFASNIFLIPLIKLLLKTKLR